MLSDKHLLAKYLKTQNLMSVATYGEHPWIASVYYVIDDKFNFYFLSEPNTQHCQDIESNQYVSCTIADSSQKVTSKKVGVQMYGTASKVSNIEKMKWMLKMWNKLNPGFESIINLKNIQTNKINSKIYKVKPKVIKFFNEELYGPEGFKLFKLS